MNLALFVTQANREGIEAFINETSRLQHTSVNGAVVLIHDGRIPNIDQLIQPLKGVFKIDAKAPIALNKSLSQNGQVAAMFARFVLSIYSRFPGPWLIVDDYAVPTGDNPITEVERQHRASGGKMSGRGTVNPGSVIPIGPVTIELNAKEIKVLRFSTNESWRQRGQYIFGRCGFGLVNPSDYLFSISEKSIEAAEAMVKKVAPPKPVITRDQIKLPPIAIEGRMAPEVAPPSFPVKASWGAAESIKDDLARIEKTTQVVETSVVLTKKELLDAVELKTGTRPHHFTSETKLQALLSTP